MTQTAKNVFRDFVTDGVPTSGAHHPRKAEIREWGASLEANIAGFQAGGGIVFQTKAAMTLGYAANQMAWVIADSTPANNGIYQKQGGSGAGSWTRVADLPYSFIVASDVGDGTSDAIVATSSLPVSGSALVLLNVFEANTGSPVTVSFNGGSPLTIKTNSGNDPAPGGLVGTLLGRVSGSTFRLVSDQASAAIIAQAETLLEEFKSLYLGAFDDDAAATTAAGGTPNEGAEYWNSTTGTRRVWHSGAWVDQAGSISDGDVTDAKVATPATPAEGINASKIKVDLAADFTGAVVRLISDKFKDVVSARDFGAYGLGNDDTAELQAFLNEMKPTGLKAWVPRGEYGLSSTLLLNNQGTNVPPGTEPAKNEVLYRTCIVGDGPGATIFRAVGDINALHFQTGLGRASHGGFSVVQASAANRVGRGILVDQSQGLHFHDIEVKGFFAGIENRDTFSANYSSIDLMNNTDGFIGINVVSGSHPNAINFNSVRFMYNTRRGCYLVNPTTCNFIGGSFEWNGSGNAGDGGLEVFGPSNEGAFGVNVFGVYFERNWGGYDVNLSNGGATRVVMHSIEKCTFNRIDAAKFVTNNIRITRPTSGFMKVLVQGNSFQGFGTYTPNAGRKYLVNLDTGGGAPASLVDANNLYGSATEAP